MRQLQLRQNCVLVARSCAATTCRPCRHPACQVDEAAPAPRLLQLHMAPDACGTAAKRHGSTSKLLEHTTVAGGMHRQQNRGSNASPRTAGRPTRDSSDDESLLQPIG